MGLHDHVSTGSVGGSGVAGTLGSYGVAKPLIEPLRDFLLTSGLPDEFTFTRAGTASYTDKDGNAQTAGVDVPRFDYDTNGNALSLLIETGPAPDLTTITGTDFSRWFNAIEGVFLIIFRRDASPNEIIILDVNDGTGGERIFLTTNLNDNIVGRMTDGGVLQANSAFGGSTYTLGTFGKVAVAYKENDFNIAFGGVAATPDTSCTIPTLTRADIGKDVGNTLWIDGHISRVVYFPNRHSDMELRALTT